MQYFVIGVLSILLGSGCTGSSGPPLGTVTGKVKINDQPVPGLKVVFVPEGKGSPSYGATDKNGVFRLLFNQNRAGAQLGMHHVQIEPREPTTDESGKVIESTPIVKVPKKYRQSGVLSAKVASGRNELNFDLVSED